MALHWLIAYIAGVGTFCVIASGLTVYTVTRPHQIIEAAEISITDNNHDAIITEMADLDRRLRILEAIGIMQESKICPGRRPERD
jgi:hypothetical protein